MPLAPENKARLQQIVGAQHVHDRGERLEYASEDFFKTWRGQAAAIVFPGSTEEIAECINFCRNERFRVVPQGGATGLVWGSVPDKSSDNIIINFSRLKTISGLDPVNRTIIAEAGVTVADLNDYLAEHGLYFPVSLGSEGTCQIGGIINTNAGGHNVLRYGMTRQHVLGIEVVLADGSVLSNLRALHKNNVGYDLAQLFCGAEGTLGLVSKAALKLVPLARQNATALISVQSPESVISLYNLLACELSDFLSAFELIPHIARKLVSRHFPQQSLPEITEAPWYVLIELGSATQRLDLSGLLTECLGVVLESEDISDAVIAQSEEQRRRFWAAREAMVFAQSKHGPVLSHDVSVRVSRIPELIERGSAKIDNIHPNAKIMCFGHVGDGNLHFNVIGPAADTSFKQEFGFKIENALYELIAEMGGSISAEHGIGRKKLPFFTLCRTEAEIATMCQINSALDPEGLLNPGVLLTRNHSAEPRY